MIKVLTLSVAFMVGDNIYICSFLKLKDKMQTHSFIHLNLCSTTSPFLFLFEFAPLVFFLFFHGKDKWLQYRGFFSELVRDPRLCQMLAKSLLLMNSGYFHLIARFVLVAI